MRNIIKFILIITLVHPVCAYPYDTNEEIKKSTVEIEKLTKEASNLEEKYKMRIILDVSGGISRLLKKTYSGTSENDFQLAYSFALIHLAILAEQMNFQKAATCHMQEDEFMLVMSKSNKEDLTKMPKCRLDIYNPGARAEALALMTANPEGDIKYNTSAGALIKQISINSYYTTKSIRSLGDK